MYLSIWGIVFNSVNLNIYNGTKIAMGIKLEKCPQGGAMEHRNTEIDTMENRRNAWK